MTDTRNDRLKEIEAAISELANVVRKRLLAARRGQKAEHDAFVAGLKARISRPFNLTFGAKGPEVHVAMRATGGQSSGDEVPAAHDMEGFILGYFEKDITDAAATLLDEEYTFGNFLVMSEDEQRDALREVEEQILALQREASDLQFEALAAGSTVRFDPSYDPRAVIGALGPALPRPRKSHAPLR